MRMTTACLGAALAVMAAAADAGATALSMNEAPLRAGATVEQCKTAGKAALQQAGLRLLPDSPASVFGVNDQDVLAAVYCLPARGIAMVAVAGPDSQNTRPILNALLRQLAGN